MNYSVYLQMKIIKKHVTYIYYIKIQILNIIIKRGYCTREKASFKPLRSTLIWGSMGRVSHRTSIRVTPVIGLGALREGPDDDIRCGAQYTNQILSSILSVIRRFKILYLGLKDNASLDETSDDIFEQTADSFFHRLNTLEQKSVSQF